MIQESRVMYLRKTEEREGSYVLLWIQASQRAGGNHALEYAIERADEQKKPVVAFFGITDRYPGANERHYRFMLEGLRELRGALEERGIQLVTRHTSPEEGVVELAPDASLVVTDRGYTRVQREWRRSAASRLGCPFIQVESDVVVPVEEVSEKEEYSAATIRPKITRLRPDYLVPLDEKSPRRDSLGMRFESFSLEDLDEALSRLDIDRSVKKTGVMARGGASEARKKLETFLEEKLDRYDEQRNDPTADGTSSLSPYLHFGQISPLSVALSVKERGGKGADAFLEELIVRRELAVNFTFSNSRYDSIEGLPEWCRKTLREHEEDEREYVYSAGEFERARTHDPYWNAAQTEIVTTGKMHGYMRMYWGKKILEWTRTPADAFRIALSLNDRYEIDGRDPNGFAGVAWCFGKHDRPWKERPIFGKIRYMNDRGLRRKFDADGYVRMIGELSGDGG